MEFAKISKQEKFHNELANEKMALTSTLKSLTELGYDYVKDLGIGQFGKVIEMIHPSTKINCAIKIVKEEDITEGELYVWPGLCHQNILKLHGFHYIAEGRRFIFITKKYPCSLDEKLGGVKFIFDSKAFDRAVSWVQDVTKAIAYLHEKGIAHMDIKTNNVLISDNDRAVVTDFGSLSSTDETSVYTSPIPYRPPETYGMNGSWETVDGLKYDCWTMGMLCIRVFTRENFSQQICRQKEFWPKKMYPLIFEVLQKESFATKMKACFPRSQKCSFKADDVLNLIKACLQLDPKKRITIKEVLNHTIFGGEVFYKWEENNPWSKKRDCEEIERLIFEFKVCQKNTSVYTEENNSMAERKVDVVGKLLADDKNDTEILVDPNQKIKKDFNEEQIKIGFTNKVSTKKVTNDDRNDNKEKIVRDSFVKSAVFNDLEHKMKEKCKTDKRMPVEIILSANTLYKDIKSQGEFGTYLKEMDTRLKQIPEMKLTNKVVDWAREKKNSLSKMFARFRSTK